MREFLDIRRIGGRRSTSRSHVPRHVHEDVLITGQPVNISLRSLMPSEAVSVSLGVRGEVELSFPGRNQVVATDTPLRLAEIPPQLSLLAQTYSDELRDRIVEITFSDNRNLELVSYELQLTALRICLDVDADRDGVIEENNPHKADWKRGLDGYGAILLVNSDQDIDYSDGKEDFSDSRINGLLDIKDMNFMIVRRVGPGELPWGWRLRLSVSRETSRRIRVFDELEARGHELIGPGRSEADLRSRDTGRDLLLAIEGIHYRDRDFDGLVEVKLILYQDERPVHSDRVTFRVAPWIMTPNTLSPTTVYVCRLKDGSNAELIASLRQIVGQANAQLEVVPPNIHRGDRWMQDEIEIGYTQGPGHLTYVVLDSPRDRDLDQYPEKLLILRNSSVQILATSLAVMGREPTP